MSAIPSWPTLCTCMPSSVDLQLMLECGAPCRLQLWRKLLDKMVVEDMWLRNLLGLPERDAWNDEKEESQTSDAGMIQTFTVKLGDVKYMLLTAGLSHDRCKRVQVNNN